MSLIKLAIDFEITPELVKLYAESTHCPFVGEKDGPYCEIRAKFELEKIARSKMYGKFERLGIMKIFWEDELVGFSLPREMVEREHPIFKLPEGLKYHRIGTVYVGKGHRGKGIMMHTILMFKTMYPNLVWTCDDANISSQKSAVRGGLKFSHLIYFKSREEWSFEPLEDCNRISHVYSN